MTIDREAEWSSTVIAGKYLGIEITRTKHGLLLTQQRLVDSIYDKAKAYIDKYNVASMDFPIKFNRLKKATEQPTPEEHLELKKFPFRSHLGAVGFLMTRSISSLYSNSSLTSRSIRHRFSSVPIGGMSSLRLVMLTGTIRSFIFQLLALSCFTAAIRFHGLAERSATLHTR